MVRRAKPFLPSSLNEGLEISRFRLTQEPGFTIIETLACLVIMAVMMTMAGMWLTQTARAFAMAKASASLAGKAEVAMLRLAKEFSLIKSVSNASSSSISFTTKHGPNDVSYNLSLAGSDLKLNNDVLTGSVSSMNLSYFDAYNAAAQTSWSSSRKVMQVTLTMIGPEGANPSFALRIAPRNL